MPQVESVFSPVLRPIHALTHSCDSNSIWAGNQSLKLCLSLLPCAWHGGASTDILVGFGGR